MAGAAVEELGADLGDACNTGSGLLGVMAARWPHATVPLAGMQTMKHTAAFEVTIARTNPCVVHPEG